jgi:O-antigen ligase
MEAKKLSSSNKNLINRFELIMAVGLVLFLVGLPFHLVIKRLLPGPVGTYWKEILLGLLIVIWGILSLLNRRLLLSGTTLDMALLAFLGYIILRLVLDRFGNQALWGFYYSVMYLPVFFVVVVMLHRFPAWLEKLVWLIVLLGAIVAIGGVLEFILNRSLWPSSEIIQRQGFPDVYIYGTHLRRVYFVFDSPTTLANTLALIFPLSLGMVFAASNTKTKLLAGAATLIMIICIGFTFSRGIWVASAVGLVVMGLLAGFFQQNKRLTLGLVGIAFLGLVVWIGITTLRTNHLPSTNSGLVELNTEEYRNAPVLGVEQSLLQQKPVNGESTLQTWTLFDPLQQQNDQRIVLYEPALKNVTTEVIYRITVPDFGALRFAIALSPQVWSPDRGDGVDFRVYIAPVDTPQSGQFLLNRYINPKINPSDRRWRNYLIDLSAWVGKEVNISFIIDSGPAQNWDYDWAGWADVSIVLMPDGYFNSKSISGDNIVVQYFRSISDWVHDETNLDRLAAWNLALDAWRKSPIWGTGLGSTGLAVFRTNPENAFVTESQVLKVLTELGIPGIILFAFIWFTIAKIGVQTLRDPLSSKNKAILFGILTSMVIIFIEGWVYQNMEAKQVNALFWTLTGMLAFLSINKDA